ncbi:signal peptidase II [Clostridium sp.]|uniref:signal peptidase II n=1 Tax=Clostridium sp. TaxID=1506 RepID=UPI0025C6D47D|nr:signal peptidase II [Clostridium sp.]
MTNKLNKDKWLTTGLLPIMWLLYFAFEIITGRVDSFYTLAMNLLLTIVFALTGWIIYITSQKYSNGFTSKVVFTIFLVLMLIDQGVKIIIKLFYFDNYFEIIPKFLSFDPIINTDGSWLNARFGLGVGFPALIILNALAVILFIEVYRYYLYKGNKDFWSDMAFLFILSGALCSLIDKIFYGGSLDFIGISNLFIADIKDMYINLGILFFIMLIYIKGYFKEEDSSTLKDDLESAKKFFKFMKNDIFRK